MSRGKPEARSWSTSLLDEGWDDAEGDATAQPSIHEAPSVVDDDDTAVQSTSLGRASSEARLSRPFDTDVMEDETTVNEALSLRDSMDEVPPLAPAAEPAHGVDEPEGDDGESSESGEGVALPRSPSAASLLSTPVPPASVDLQALSALRPKVSPREAPAIDRSPRDPMARRRVTEKRESWSLGQLATAKLGWGPVTVPVFVVGLFSALVVAALAYVGARYQAGGAQGATLRTTLWASEANSLEARAWDGDASALDELREIELKDRSTAQIVALAVGRDALRLREVEGLEAVVAGGRELTGSQLTELLELARDPRTSTRAMALLARGGSRGADVLYRLWTETKAKTRSTQLAQQLLYSEEVRARASEALSVALDLRAGKSCRNRLNVLPRAAQHGDVRSLHLLERMQNKFGCGKKGAEDCNPCMRGTEDLDRALVAVRQRPGPEF